MGKTYQQVGFFASGSTGPTILPGSGKDMLPGQPNAGPVPILLLPARCPRGMVFPSMARPPIRAAGANCLMAA